MSRAAPEVRDVNKNTAVGILLIYTAFLFQRCNSEDFSKNLLLSTLLSATVRQYIITHRSTSGVNKCIVLYCIVLYWWSGHLLLNAVQPFQIYCAPPSLGITRT